MKEAVRKLVEERIQVLTNQINDLMAEKNDLEASLSEGIEKAEPDLNAEEKKPSSSKTVERMWSVEIYDYVLSELAKGKKQVPLADILDALNFRIGDKAKDRIVERSIRSTIIKSKKLKRINKAVKGQKATVQYIEWAAPIPKVERRG